MKMHGCLICACKYWKQLQLLLTICNNYCFTTIIIMFWMANQQSGMGMMMTASNSMSSVHPNHHHQIHPQYSPQLHPPPQQAPPSSYHTSNSIASSNTTANTVSQVAKIHKNTKANQKLKNRYRKALNVFRCVKTKVLRYVYYLNVIVEMGT